MSEFKFACPVCGQHITCDAASSGARMDCPTCFRQLIVPEAKAAGASPLVLTAALAQTRPATSVSSQTELLAARRRRRKHLPLAALGLAVVVIGAVAAGFAFRDVIFRPRQAATPPTASSHPAGNQRRLPASPAPDAAQWTLNLPMARIPDAPARGAVNGREFNLERATIQQGRLDLRQGPRWPPEVGVSVHLFAQRTGDLANRSVIIEAGRTNAPRMILRWKNEQGEPVTRDFQHGYALKVEFGSVTNRRLPGKIFLAFPDDSRSYVAGTFDAEIRAPRH